MALTLRSVGVHFLIPIHLVLCLSCPLLRVALMSLSCRHLCFYSLSSVMISRRFQFFSTEMKDDNITRVSCAHVDFISYRPQFHHAFKESVRNQRTSTLSCWEFLADFFPTLFQSETIQRETRSKIDPESKSCQSYWLNQLCFSTCLMIHELIWMRYCISVMYFTFYKIVEFTWFIFV